ncbi:hypothetical protein ACLQ29_31295 [Micromonospora sp. DT228]|uniref:hypothetical protein n=1 Tax=Micromonospora sp. DT228 TaxID=3393443 RepID=UPI003CF1424B
MEDWQALSIYDGDPTPGTPATISAMATAMQRRTAEINGHTARLRSVASNSAAMRLRGDYATTVDHELGRLPGTARALADAYLACAKALSAFANDLTQLQVQSRGALQIGMTADSQYRAMLQQFCGLTGMLTYGPGVWRGLNESYAAPLREPVRSQALGIARNARLCEAERERARASALQAKQRYAQVAARCAQAIQAAIPRSTPLGEQRRKAGSGASQTTPTSTSAPATGPAAPPATAPVAGPAGKIPLKPVHDRHHLNRIRPKNPTKPINTVVLPGTDVARDLADIAAGLATWDADRSRYVVNGRTYGVEDTGTVFPETGPGLVRMERMEYKALKTYIQFGGDLDAANAQLDRDPYITPAHRERAMEVFRHHKNYRE